MWTWPLDNAKRATAAHRKSERVADGTCTQVWAWMTNKCRRRMNQGKGYITSKISQKKKRKKKRKSSWEARGDGNSHPRTRSPFPLGVGPSDSMFLAPTWSSPIPKQAVAPSEPNFWTHSLQIHCNRSVGPRSRPSLGPVRKPWPYKKFSTKSSPIGDWSWVSL